MKKIKCIGVIAATIIINLIIGVTFDQFICNTHRVVSFFTGLIMGYGAYVYCENKKWI